jgi:hypothetical protein
MKVQASSIDFSGDKGIKLRQQNSHFHPEHHNELKTLEQDFEDQEEPHNLVNYFNSTGTHFMVPDSGTHKLL